MSCRGFRSALTSRIWCRMPGWSRWPELAQRLGVGERIDETVTLAGPVGANSGAKALTVIGSVLAGGDCIDDVNLLRSGALPELFDGVRAPSTVGSWLRALRWGHVRQLAHPDVVGGGVAG